MSEIFHFPSKPMTSQELEQIKSYSILIVAELHRAILHEVLFDPMKNTLRLAEEFEMYIWQMENKKRQQKETAVISKGKSNVIQFHRIA